MWTCKSFQVAQTEEKEYSSAPTRWCLIGSTCWTDKLDHVLPATLQLDRASLLNRPWLGNHEWEVQTSASHQSALADRLKPCDSTGNSNNESSNDDSEASDDDSDSSDDESEVGESTDSDKQWALCPWKRKEWWPSWTWRSQWDQMIKLTSNMNSSSPKIPESICWSAL